MKKNYLTSILFAFLLIGACSTLSAQIISNGTYKIFNSVNSEVVSINTLPSGDPNNPADLAIGRAKMATPDSNDDLQLWSFSHQGNDVYKITNVGDNSLLGIKDGWCGDFGDVQVGFDSTSAYTLIKITAADVTDTYVFQIAFDSACNFGSSNTPVKAFDIDGGTNAKLQTFPTNTGNANQQFQILDPAALSEDTLNNLNNIEVTYQKNERSVSIKSLENIIISKMQVFNLTGQLVYSTNDFASSEIEIDFTSVTNGLYIIAIESNTFKTVKKVLIH